MKRLKILFIPVLGFALNAAFAGETPRGSLLELHSCEVYAGGCTVSSEFPQSGCYMLRVWNFSGGNFNGAELKGLQIAALQTSSDNLATSDSKSGDAVVYLPAAATQTQRDALLAWLKSSQKDFHPARIETRVTSLEFAKSEKGYMFMAGKFVSVKAASLDDSCGFTCGESLWYQPRAATSYFTVALNSQSQVAEPLLKLSWTDSGKRSVFLGRFGETAGAKDVYVTLNDLCGGTKGLF
jgi:hypothetical protein